MISTRKKIMIEVEMTEEKREELARKLVTYMISTLLMSKGSFNVLLGEIEPRTEFVLKDGSLIIHHS